MDGLLDILSNAVQFIGQALIVLGLVNVGLTMKDGVSGGGGKLSGAVTMIVAGGCIFAVARMIHAT